MSTLAALAERVELYLELTGESPTGLGTRAIRNSAFVIRLRAGTDFRSATVDKVNKYLDEHWPRGAPRVKPQRERATVAA